MSNMKKIGLNPEPFILLELILIATSFFRGIWLAYVAHGNVGNSVVNSTIGSAPIQYILAGAFIVVSITGLIGLKIQSWNMRRIGLLLTGIFTFYLSTVVVRADALTVGSWVGNFLVALTAFTLAARRRPYDTSGGNDENDS